MSKEIMRKKGNMRLLSGMATSDHYHRTVKIQISGDTTSGGTKAKVSIPAQIRREAGIEARSFMEWKETSGKIRCQPAAKASLHTSSVFPGGTEQLYCVFPGVFWRKYGIAKGTVFHWEMQAGKVQGVVEVPKFPQRYIRAKDKSLEKVHTVKLLRHESRLRINIPVELCQLLNLKPGHFMRWEENPGSIQCIPDVYEHMNTTMIEQRKAGMQVEIPKLLGDKHHLQGGECTWKLEKGKLVGDITV